MGARKRLISIFALFSLCALPSHSEAQSLIVEDWGASMGGFSCQISLNREKQDLHGVFIASETCPSLLQAVKSFTFTDSNRTDLILFSEPDLRGSFGDLQAQGDWADMAGQVGGQRLSLSFVAYEEFETSGVVAEDCKPYVNSDDCAAALDLDIPNIPAFQTEPLMSLSAQRLYPFSGGAGIALDEWVQPGQCLAAKGCKWDDRSEASWCEIVLSDGFRTGYLKQLDHDQVYVERGC